MIEDIIRMEGIAKTFPGVLTLDQCRFDLQSSEVFALVGENGAGVNPDKIIDRYLSQRRRSYILKDKEVEPELF